MRVVFVAVMLLCVVQIAAVAETRDYSISVVQEADAAKPVLRDIVVVHFFDAKGRAASADLNVFMQDIVPNWLLAQGVLPAPGAVPTLVDRVTVPHAKNCFIVDDQQPPCQPHCVRADKRPLLPVYLRVKVENLPDHQVAEKRGEKFEGIVADPWALKSYFITKYSVVARVNKLYTTKNYRHVSKKVVNGTYTKFRWVDP